MDICGQIHDNRKWGGQIECPRATCRTIGRVVDEWPTYSVGGKADSSGDSTIGSAAPGTLNVSRSLSLTAGRQQENLRSIARQE